MKNSVITSYVGYAIKEKKALFGLNGIIGMKIPYVVLYDDTLSNGSKDKLLTYLTKHGIEGFCVDVERIYPNRNCKAIGVTDKNLASAIIKEMKENRI
jgi:hypothetical protein